MHSHRAECVGTPVFVPPPIRHPTTNYHLLAAPDSTALPQLNDSKAGCGNRPRPDAQRSAPVPAEPATLPGPGFEDMCVTGYALNKRPALFNPGHPLFLSISRRGRQSPPCSTCGTAPPAMLMSGIVCPDSLRGAGLPTCAAPVAVSPLTDTPSCST